MNAPVIEESVTEQYLRESGEARELMAVAIAERGEEYRYQMPAGADDCQYLTYETYEDGDGDDTYLTSDTTRPLGPSCLVGCMLVEKGLALDVIATIEGNTAETAVYNVGAFKHPVVREALRVAQREQDTKATWGMARAAFEKALSDYETRADTAGVALGAELP